MDIHVVVPSSLAAPAAFAPLRDGDVLVSHPGHVHLVLRGTDVDGAAAVLRRCGVNPVARGVELRLARRRAA